MPILSPHDARDRLLARLTPVKAEGVPLARAIGRVLAEAVVSDRDSPPQDVSAMDGFAMLRDQATPGAAWPIGGESRMGQPPAALKTGTVVRVSTGAAVPADAELVVKREDVQESVGTIRLREDYLPGPGSAHIRRRGENAPAGQVVLAAGSTLTPAGVGAAAAMGIDQPRVHRRVRVGVLITGDEFAADGQCLPPWQIRDSNGPAIAAFLGRFPFVDPLPPRRCPDQLGDTTAALRELQARCDLVITSGGVSMGDRDHVPAAAAAADFQVVYHKLAMRPGKPNFAAVHPTGQAVLGLPGNPVSVLCGLTQLVAPALRHLAGSSNLFPDRQRITLDPSEAPNPEKTKTLPLWHYQLARLTAPGHAMLIAHRGSGDLTAAAAAHGFIQTPPHQSPSPTADFDVC